MPEEQNVDPKDARLGRTFFITMIVLGLVGTGFAVMAFVQATGVG